MKDLLIQQGIHKALQGKLNKSKYDKWVVWKIYEKANSAIHLNLSNEVIHNVNLTYEETTEDIWNNLEQLYGAKNLSNKLYV